MQIHFINLHVHKIIIENILCCSIIIFHYTESQNYACVCVVLLNDERFCDLIGTKNKTMVLICCMPIVAYFVTDFHLPSYLIICFSGIMVSMLASSVVDRGFKTFCFMV